MNSNANTSNVNTKDKSGIVGSSMNYVSSFWSSTGAKKDTYMLETMSRQIEELNNELEVIKYEFSNSSESLKYYKDKCKNLEVALLSIS